MATEYKLSYTASEIDEKLGKIDENTTNISKLSEEIGLVTTKIVDISKQFSVGKTYNFNTENGSISDALSDVITLSQGSYFGYINMTVKNLNYSDNGAIYLQWLHTINGTCDERHAGAVNEYPLKNGEIELFGSFTVDSGMVKAVLTRKGGTGNFSFDFTVNKLYLLENVTSDDVIETIRKKEYNEKLMSVVIDDNSITAEKLSEDLIDKFSSGNDLVIDCWGDSLTAGAGSTNYPYPTKLQELIGNSVVVNNYGEGGDNANDVAFRQGALGAIVQPFKVGSKASDFNYIEFSAINGSDISKMSMSGAYHGNGFVYLDGTDKYMFRQSGDGAYLLVGEGRLLGKTYTRPIFMNAEGKGTRHIIIICIGQNGWHDSNVDHLADIISLMIQHNNYEKYIIVGRPTGDKTSRNEEETVLGTRFGNKFVNAREYISSCGLSENSLEATNDDFTAMTNGAIPPQLLSDEVHLNDYGYISMANCIYQRGKILGYWS